MQRVAQKYKQTDIGIIPHDWENNDLDIIADVIDPHPSHRAPVIDINGIPFVGIGDLNEKGELNNDKVRKVPEQIFYEHKGRYNLEENLIGLGRVASIGKVVRLKNYKEKYTISPTLGIIHSKSVVTDYLYHILNFKTTKDQFRQIMSGSTRSSVGMIVLRKLQIPLPPTKAEQTAIATALSDADNYITHVEKLIVKKRLIKQGAMQQLLQPKEGWVVKKLGQIGKTYGGLSGKKKEDFQRGIYPYIPFMNIMSNPVIDTNYFDFVYISSSENQNKALKGDLFFNGSSETPEEVGMCSLLTEDIKNLYLNSFCFGFRLFNKQEMNGLFLSYFFRSSEGRKLIFSLAQGATRYNLSKTNFLKLELSLPTFEEQTQIATILSDMDEEIFTLENQLAKSQSIKQGMMQQLLTGKIRLV